MLITIYRNVHLIIWDVISGQKIRQFSTHFTIEGISINDDEAILLVYGEAGIAILKMNSWEMFHNTHAQGEIFHAGFLGVTQSVVVTTFASGVLIFRNLGGKPRFIFPHDMDYHFPIVSEDGKYIITFACEKYIAVWDVITGDLLWEKHHNGLGSMALTSKDKYVSYCCSENTVTLWELESGKQIFHQNLGSNIIDICPLLLQ